MISVLRSRFDILERQRRELLEDMHRLAPAQLAFRPSPDAWSLGHVVQHLVLVEEGTLQFLTHKSPRPDDRSLAQRARFHAFRLLAPSAIRVKAPVPGILPTLDASLDDLTARWDAVRARLAHYLEGVSDTQLPLTVVKHPFGGPLTIAETLEIMRLHIIHHGHQLRRIRHSAGFPIAQAPSIHGGASA